MPICVGHELTVYRVEQESPFVRVYCHFSEGGTPTTNMSTTYMDFLVRMSDQPRVGETLRMKIEGDK
jgi:hypothetical protein